MKIINTIYCVLFVLGNISLLSCDGDYASVKNKTSSKSFFESKVVNVLQNKCLSCHGIKQDAYVQFMADENKEYFYFPITENNKISDIETSYKVSISYGRVEYGEESRFSHILRSPLTEEYGGIAHK
jgi:hypothetical protein